MFFFYSQTDDFGVFSTCLSREFEIASKTFNLTFKNLVQLCYTAVNHSFASAEEKKNLTLLISTYAKSQGITNV